MRRLPLLAAAASLAVALAPRACAQAGEYDVKAAFLVSFTRFVTWPDPPPGERGIVVVGPDPFGRTLDEDATDASLPYPLAVLRARSGEVPAATILFAGRDSGRAGIEALRAAPRGTLTVGETDEFLAHGGIVSLVLADGHVRVEINVDAAQRSGLQISSRLLQVATLRHESELR